MSPGPIRAPHFWIVVPAAGRGERLDPGTPKQYLPLAGATVLEHALRPFIVDPRVTGIVVALAEGDSYWDRLPCATHALVTTTRGGATRMESVLNALDALDGRADQQDWVLVHDAARPCLSGQDIDRLIQALKDDEVGGLLAIRVTDTLRREGELARGEKTVDREGLWRAQTPQMFRYAPLRAALRGAIERGTPVTDEASAMEAAGARPRLIEGTARNVKITERDDLALAEAILLARKNGTKATNRVGFGFDVHAFGPGDHVVLGGVRVPFGRGVVAHSDGDVILHALCDALLGAAGLGDIGQHFPDTDAQWKGAASRILLERVMELVSQRGLRVVNADVTLLAEEPRLAQHRAAISEALAHGLRVGLTDVNVKATSLEKLGFLGRGEGLAAQATVLLTGMDGRSSA